MAAKFSIELDTDLSSFEYTGQTWPQVLALINNARNVQSVFIERDYQHPTVDELEELIP
jgi:hypothetical protein